MKKTKNGVTMNKVLMVGGALVSLSAMSANEAQAATGAGLMSAVVLSPITITPVEELNFGSFTRGTAGGTVIVTAGGVRSKTGSVGLVTGAGNEQAGVLKIAGGTGVPITFSVAAADTVNDGGTNTMVVNAFNLRTDAGGTSETITMVASPTSYPVGATVTVGAAQVAGTYTGSYTATAVYQ